MFSEYPQLRVTELAGPGTLPDLLGGLLNAAARETRARDAVIIAPGIGEIRWGQNHHERALCQWPGKGALNHHGHSSSALLVLGPENSVRCDGDLCKRRCAPIVYQDKSMGCVAFTFEQEGGVGHSEFLQSFAREVAFLVKRHDVSVYARRKLGIEAELIGSSRALRRMEEAIEKVAQTELPVLIEAEFGSQELAVAAAIHCCSARCQGPFVVTRCASQLSSTFRDELAGAFEKARGGTLFLQHIDELEQAMQKELLSFFRPSNCFQGQPAVGEVRIVASTSRPFEDLVKEGRISRFLRAAIGVLKVEVPALRECREDIRLLLEHEMRKHRRHSPKSFSPQALAVCEAYGWPENLLELQRVAARLAVMTDGDCIDVADLQQHLGGALAELWENDGHAQSHAAAAMVEEQAGEQTQANDESEMTSDELNGNLQQPEKRIVDLALSLLAGAYDNLDKYGVGMKRALTFVAGNFDHDISLTQLAKQSFFSPSHLSFLFKKTLGISFKGMLAVIRIEKAKQLLLERPCDSITEISLDVGFGDLSHFEKTFKRSTGLNPREYRRKKLAELERCF